MYPVGLKSSLMLSVKSLRFYEVSDSKLIKEVLTLTDTHHPVIYDNPNLGQTLRMALQFVKV